MKAKELKKVSITIEHVYKDIKENNDLGYCKICYPHYEYISEEVIKQLIEDGFVLTVGVFWNFDYGLIIQW